MLTRQKRVFTSNARRAAMTTWTPALRAAWEVALSVRATTLARRSNRARPIPIRPEDRFIFLTESGMRLSVDAMEAAWQDLMRSAIAGWSDHRRTASDTARLQASRCDGHERKEGRQAGQPAGTSRLQCWISTTTKLRLCSRQKAENSG